MIQTNQILKRLRRECDKVEMQVRRTNKLGKDGIAKYRFWMNREPNKVVDVAVLVLAYRKEYAVALVEGLYKDLK